MLIVESDFFFFFFVVAGAFGVMIWVVGRERREGGMDVFTGFASLS